MVSPHAGMAARSNARRSACRRLPIAAASVLAVGLALAVGVAVALGGGDTGCRDGAAPGGGRPGSGGHRLGAVGLPLAGGGGANAFGAGAKGRGNALAVGVALALAVGRGGGPGLVSGGDAIGATPGSAVHGQCGRAPRAGGPGGGEGIGCPILGGLEA